MRLAASVVFALAGFISLPSALAKPEVTAALSQQTAAVGQPVQLSITVNGSQSAEVPREFAVDGLRVQYRGQSSSIQIINFAMSATVTHTFVLVPEREGAFEIPPIDVRVGRESLQTPPLQLDVRGVATLPSPPAPGSAAQSPQSPQMPMNPFRPPVPPSTGGNAQSGGVPVDRVAFAELVIPEGEIFVGQVVPVEIRIFLDRRFQFQIDQMPTFSGEGFTVEKLGDPIERQTEIDGVPYQTITFRTSLTPVKAGVLKVSPAKLSCAVVVPGGGGGSLLDEFFGGNPFGDMFGERRQLDVVSNGAEVRVNALPKDGRPANFGGAIGQFTLDAKVRPSKTRVGEPIKIAVSVTGKGNFSAIQQPEILADPAWRIYPGAESFVPADMSGLSGTKTFEATIMPTRETSESPKVEFSFFDPSQKKYVTLTAGPEPVEVSGGTAPAPVPAPTAVQSAPSPVPGDAAPSEAEREEDVAPVVSASVIFETWRPGGFIPMATRPEFLIANIAALVAFICFALYLGLAAYHSTPASRAKSLREEQGRLLREMENPSLQASAFYENAARILQAQIRIHSGNFDGVVDEHILCTDTLLTPDLRDKVASLLHQRGEMKFSTAPRDPSALQRAEAVAALKQIQKQYS